MFFLVKKKKKKKKVKIRLKKRLREESNKEETELGGWTTEAGSLLVGRKPGGWEEGWDKMHGSQKHQIPCVHCAGRVCILLLRVPPASQPRGDTLETRAITHGMQTLCPQSTARFPDSPGRRPAQVIIVRNDGRDRSPCARRGRGRTPLG